MAFDSAAKRTVMFGGRVSDLPAHLVSTTWAWDGSDWEELDPASHPSAREWHAMAYDPVRDEMVMFGGYDGKETTGDTWTFHDGNWSRREPAVSPSLRYGHLMAFDPALQQVILFGGFTGDNGGRDFLNDTWAWDGSTWTELHPSASPSPRARGRLAYDPARGRLVTFGGQTSGPNEDDTWGWDGATWVEEATRKTPRHRFDYGLSTLGRHLVMYGGTVNYYEGDTWILKGDGWHKVLPAGPWPWERSDMAMAWDSARREAVLFGGLGDVDDTWTLTP